MLPYAFTEYGALMAANILNSARAIQMSIFVVRAFAKMREALRGTPELARKLAALEKKLTARLDVHEAAIVQVLRESHANPESATSTARAGPAQHRFSRCLKSSAMDCSRDRSLPHVRQSS